MRDANRGLCVNLLKPYPTIDMPGKVRVDRIQPGDPVDEGRGAHEVCFLDELKAWFDEFKPG